MPTWREHIDINLAWRVALCAVAAVVVGLGLTWPGHRFPAVGIICLIIGCLSLIHISEPTRH